MSDFNQQESLKHILQYKMYWKCHQRYRVAIFHVATCPLQLPYYISDVIIFATVLVGSPPGLRKQHCYICSIIDVCVCCHCNQTIKRKQNVFAVVDSYGNSLSAISCWRNVVWAGMAYCLHIPESVSWCVSTTTTKTNKKGRQKCLDSA